MHSKKISKKRGFSLEDMPKLKVKGNDKIIEHDPSKRFRSAKAVRVALLESLETGDGDAFKEILAAYLEVSNKDDFARWAGIPRRTLFRMLSPTGNPTLDNIVKLVSALKKAA